MEKNIAQGLLKRYKAGNCTQEEKAIVETWYLELPTDDKGLSPDELEQAVNRVAARLPVQPKLSKQKLLWPRITAAASILFFLSVGGYFAIRHRITDHPLAKNMVLNDILPGGNKAFLTLSNGKHLVLTDIHIGKLATEGNSIISKIADGQITYTESGSPMGKPIYNTMSTPRGGQYTLTLADGTKVILNAASSLRFPTKFSGTERKVELTGEAYFEVAHNKTMPFHVISKQQDVKVLGTHFNINSYDNEPGTKTTLLEGSVLINGKAVLKPGQQAVVSGALLKVYTANTELAVAWKNHKFIFDNEDIQGIMRMITRWYNVEVAYTGDIPDQKFGGSVSRFDNVSKVLGILELTGNIHFKIEGRRIIVSK